MVNKPILLDIICIRTNLTLVFLRVMMRQVTLLFVYNSFNVTTCQINQIRGKKKIPVVFFCIFQLIFVTARQINHIRGRIKKETKKSL